MWDTVSELKKTGVTVILTTHYIEEAEALADRVGVINDGKILLVEKKASLMAQLGKKQIRLHLAKPLDTVPESLARYNLARSPDGRSLVYTYDTQGDRTGITALLNDLRDAGLVLKDVSTHESSLEEIFVDLVSENAA